MVATGVGHPLALAEEYLTLDKLDLLLALKKSPRWRPIFVTGTDTEVGKTYISAHLAKALHSTVYGAAALHSQEHPKQSSVEPAKEAADVEHCKAANHLAQSNQFKLTHKQRELAHVEHLVGYYKAAISGSPDLESSDAGYVKQLAHLRQDLSTMTPYHFVEPLSPHLAAERTGKRLSFAKIIDGFIGAYEHSERLVFEGTGGLFCPFGVTDEAIVLNQTTSFGPINDIEALYTWVRNQEQSLIVQMQARERNQLVDTKEVLAELNSEVDQYSELAKFTAAKVIPRQFTICDIMRFLHATVNLGVVLVGNSGLGCINHITSTFNCLQQAGFQPQEIVIVMNNFKDDDPMHRSNLQTVKQMNPALGVFTVGTNEDASAVFTRPDFVGVMQHLLVRQQAPAES